MYSSRSIVQRFVYAIAIIFVFGFSIFAFRGVLFPPVVTLTNIQDGMHVPAGVVRVEGTTKRVNELFVQGKQISQSLQGDFGLDVAVFAPYTIIEIAAKDRFNKIIKKQVRLSVE